MPQIITHVMTAGGLDLTVLIIDYPGCLMSQIADVPKNSDDSWTGRNAVLIDLLAMIAEPFSPDAFKENVAPRLPVSGGKARSPGLSPLGRKKMRARTEQSRDLPQQPGGVQSKTPKRSLNFGGSSLVRFSINSWQHL